MKNKIPEFNREVFAKRVRALRLKHDLTQEEVATALNVTRGAYGGCENAAFRPSVDILLGIKFFFQQKGEKDISMDWLFGYTDNQEGHIMKADQKKEISALKAEIAKLEDIISDKTELIKLFKGKNKG